MEQRAYSTLLQKGKPATVRVISAFVLFTLTALSLGSMAEGSQKGASPVRNKGNRTAQSSQKDSPKKSPTVPAASADTVTKPEAPATSADAQSEPSPKARPFTATAYCLKGRTASGVPTQRGVIAADTKVLPMGSVVKIHAGHYTGIYKVQDTGSKIRGNRVDVFVPSKAEARQFGRKNIKIEVLDPKQKKK